MILLVLLLSYSLYDYLYFELNTCLFFLLPSHPLYPLTDHYLHNSIKMNTYTKTNMITHCCLQERMMTSLFSLDLIHACNEYSLVPSPTPSFSSLAVRFTVRFAVLQAMKSWAWDWVRGYHGCMHKFNLNEHSCTTL